MSRDSEAALAGLWQAAAGDPAALERVTLTGADLLLPTDFKIGTAASAVIAASRAAFWARPPVPLGTHGPSWAA